MNLRAILENVGLSPAEYAVMWHVRDTVVQPRDVISAWTADNLPNNVPANISLEDCLQATDALVRRGLLVELTAEDIETDLARWRAEPLPVSWGVDRDRYPKDVDLTEAGFRMIESISEQEFPNLKRSPVMGYNDEAPNLIRVFGETEESCRRAVENVVARIEQKPWSWPRGSVQVADMEPLGPWWYSRFERIPSGFQVAVRRVDQLRAV
jgi:hypothetical protein